MEGRLSESGRAIFIPVLDLLNVQSLINNVTELETVGKL